MLINVVEFYFFIVLVVRFRYFVYDDMYIYLSIYVFVFDFYSGWLYGNEFWFVCYYIGYY